MLGMHWNSMHIHRTVKFYSLPKYAVFFPINDLFNGVQEGAQSFRQKNLLPGQEGATNKRQADV